MLCALIMAGGQGTRFWPLSTVDKPKQFLNLLGSSSMIQMTVNRLTNMIPMERIFVVTGDRYKDLVKEQLPDIPDRNIILEPIGRNTAPCVALSAFIINKYYKDSSIVVLPSDHLIQDENAFIDTINVANNFIEDNPSAIVTLGMKPTRPETGYGYINLSDDEINSDNHSIIKVKKFVEKPNLELAISYFRSGEYLWNSGMFIWKASNILELTNKYMNSTYKILEEIATTSDEEFDYKLKEKYKDVDNISVDYGIMEKCDDIYVIPSDFGWDDIGTWAAIERYIDKDEDNNICNGEIKTIDSTNNIILSNNKPIVAIGLENIFCVETDEIIIVTKREYIKKLNEIKKIHEL